MRPNEFDGLNKHAGRSAAGVVDPPPVGYQHLDQQPDHAARRIELAALLAFGAREPRKEVLVHATEHVPGASFLVPHPDVADHVDELPKALLVERRPGIVLREHAFESGVVVLDRRHRVIDDLSDGGLPCLRPQMAPTRFRRHPEDVLGEILVAILGGLRAPFGEHRPMALLERVGDVFQEDQPENDMLVFGGVHRAAQGVGHRPQLGLMASRCAASLFSGSSQGHMKSPTYSTSRPERCAPGSAPSFSAWEPAASHMHIGNQQQRRSAPPASTRHRFARYAQSRLLVRIHCSLSEAPHERDLESDSEGSERPPPALRTRRSRTCLEPNVNLGEVAVALVFLAALHYVCRAELSEFVKVRKLLHRTDQ